MLVVECAYNILPRVRVYCDLSKGFSRHTLIVASDQQLTIAALMLENSETLYGRYFETMLLHSAVSVHKE